MGVLLSNHQRNLLLQQMGTNIKTHKQEFCRERKRLEHTTLKGISPLSPSPQGSGNHDKEEAERVWEPERMEATGVGEQSHTLNQQKQKQQAQGLHRSVPLQIYHSFQISIFMGFLSLQMTRTLNFVPFLCSLSNYNVIMFVLYYYTLFCCILILSLRSLLFSNERQKERGSR